MKVPSARAKAVTPRAAPLRGLDSATIMTGPPSLGCPR
jgi:hypothetical protein